MPPNKHNLTPSLVARDLQIGYLFRLSRLHGYTDIARRYPIDNRHEGHLFDGEIVDGFNRLVREKHAVDIRPHLDTIDIVIGVVCAEVTAIEKTNHQKEYWEIKP
jgi:hypothetical protein